MLQTSRKILVLLLLALLPLQGAAALAAHILCASQAGVAQSLDGAHAHGGSDVAGDHTHSNDGKDSDGRQPNHSSCHPTLSTVTGSLTFEVSDTDRIYQPAALASFLRFIPEQPQPVPLA